MGLGDLNEFRSYIPPDQTCLEKFWWGIGDFIETDAFAGIVGLLISLSPLIFPLLHALGVIDYGYVVQ